MGAESLVDRMLAAEGMVDSHSLRTGQLTDQDWNNVTIAQGALAEAPIYIDDTPGLKLLKSAQDHGNCLKKWMVV